MGNVITNLKVLDSFRANLVEVNGEKIMEIDNSIEHHRDCKCKLCRTKVGNSVKIKLYLPLKIRFYYPVFIVNPMLFFWFYPKVIDAVYEKFVQVNYDVNNNLIVICYII